jgi:hypothetical protein
MKFREYINEGMGFNISVANFGGGNQTVNITYGSGIIGGVNVDHQKKKATVYLNDESTRHYIDGTPKEKKEIKSIVTAWLKSKGMKNYKVSI